MPTALAAIIGILGLAGIIFTALSWRRNDTTAIVSQQDTIVGEMRSLNDELRTTVDRLRNERDELEAAVRNLTEQVKALKRGRG